MKRLSLLLLGWLSAWAAVAQSQKLTVLPYEPGEGLMIEAPGGYGVRFTGYLQPMVEVRNYPSMPDVGALTRFRMRRMVARMTGSAAQEKINYQVQVDLTGNSDAGADASASQYLMDAWVSYKPSSTVELVFGQENAPTDSREMGMLSSSLSLVERSPVSLAFSSIREFGVFANFRRNLGGDFYVLPQLAVTNGDGADVFTKDHGSIKVGGRLDFLPFGAFSNGGQYRQVDLERERTFKLVFGGHYSYNSGVSDRRGRQSNQVVYLDDAGNEALPDYQKIGFDYLAKYRGFSSYGEYTKATGLVPGRIAQRVRNDGTTSTSFTVNGVQDVAGYVRARMIVGWGLNAQAGYFFRSGYSLDARFSRLVPESNSFLRNPTFYNRSNYYTLCVSKYMGRNYGFKMQLAVSVIKCETGTNTVTGVLLTGNEVSSILMLSYSL